MALLGEAGQPTVERALSVRDFLEADEIFSTGNHSKVVPVTRIEDRDLQKAQNDPDDFVRAVARKSGQDESMVERQVQQLVMSGR